MLNSIYLKSFTATAYCYAPPMSYLCLWFGTPVLVKPSGSKPVAKMSLYIPSDTTKPANPPVRATKILNVSTVDKCSEIYEFSSDSWRIIDHDRTRGLYTYCGGSEHIVSLKGKTYWLATDERDTHRGEYLLGFDFSSEKSSPLVRLPYQRSTFKIVILSVVREEKLSVLLQRDLRSKTEIWVTSTIDGTKPVSWSKVLALDLSPDLQISTYGNFLLDEEKKVALCCERLVVDVDVEDETMDDTIYCVGEDNNKVTQVYFRADTTYLEGPELLSYVPSLVQIEPVGSNKRKRGD